MRKKKENIEKLNIRHNLLLSAGDKERAVKYAESLGMSINSLIRLLLHQQIRGISKVVKKL